MRRVILLFLIGCKHECPVEGEWAAGRAFETFLSSTQGFLGVATSTDVTCSWDGIDILCWTDLPRQLTSEDALPVVEMALSPAASWGVARLESGDLVWFDPGRPELGPNGTDQGPYKSLWAGALYSCVVRDADDGAECGETQSTERFSPDTVGFVRAVGDDQGRFCGLGVDRTVTCWDDTGAPLDGGFGTARYAAIDGARGQICAVPVDPGPPVCFGADASAVIPDDTGCAPPQGDFDVLAVGDKAACALGADGIAQCWSENALLPAPAESLASLSLSVEHGCGIDSAGGIVCFGARSDSVRFLP